MIVVELKDGRSVDVKGGKKAIYMEEVDMTVLEVYADGELLASFKSDEVIFYHVEDDKEEQQ